MSETEPTLPPKDPQAEPASDYGLSDLPAFVQPLELGWGKALAIVTGSVFVCGFLYLWGYWHHLDVAFLDYIAFEEIIARSLFGVVPAMVLVVEGIFFGLVLGEVGPLARWFKRTEPKKLDPRKERRAAYLYFPGFLLLAIFGIIAAGFYYNEVLESALGSLVFWGGLTGWGIGLKRGWRWKQVGFAVGLALGLMATMSFFIGVGSAARLRKHPEPQRDFATTLERADAELLAGRVYAGRMGGYVFFVDPTKQSTVAVPEGNLKYLHFWRAKEAEKK